MKEELSRAAATGERIPRLIRWALLTIGLLLIITVVYLFIDQTSNKVTVANDTDVSYRLKFCLGRKRGRSIGLSSKNPIENVILEDQFIASREKFYWTYRKSEEGYLRLVATTDRGEYRFLGDNVRPWGNRISATFSDNGLQKLGCEISPFRKWFETNRSRIPLLVDWLE